MTLSYDAPPLTFADLDSAVAALRQRGMRLSAPRRLLLEELLAAEGPVSAELLARRLKLDVASVYRNLETFERGGLVRHVHLGHGPGLYVLAGRSEEAYLYCESCGAVRALAPADLAKTRSRLRKRHGYEVRFDHHAIVGTCARCLDGHTQAGEHGHAHSHTHAKPSRGALAKTAAHEHQHEHEHGHGDRIHAHSHAHGA